MQHGIVLVMLESGIGEEKACRDDSSLCGTWTIKGDFPHRMC